MVRGLVHRVRRLLTRHCSHLLPCAVLRRRANTAGAVAAERRHLLSVDISCSRGAQLLSISGTDRRTLVRFIDPASVPHSVKHSICVRFSHQTVRVIICTPFTQAVIPNYECIAFSSNEVTSSRQLFLLPILPEYFNAASVCQ